MSEKVFLTTGEVAKRYRGNLSVGTLKNWRNQEPPKGPPPTYLGHKVVYALDALEKWERSQTASQGETNDARPTA